MVEGITQCSIDTWTVTTNYWVGGLSEAAARRAACPRISAHITISFTAIYRQFHPPNFSSTATCVCCIDACKCKSLLTPDLLSGSFSHREVTWGLVLLDSACDLSLILIHNIYKSFSLFSLPYTLLIPRPFKIYSTSHTADVPV
jgi:hypothetical protein